MVGKRLLLLGTLILLGASCTPAEKADGEAPKESLPEPTPYLVDEDSQRLTPNMDAQAVGDAASQAMTTLYALGSGRIQEVLDVFLALGDDTCPGGETYDDGGAVGRAFFAECVTADGTAFAGDLYYNQTTDLPRDDGVVASGFELYSGGLRIDVMDGRSFELAGYHALSRGNGDAHFDAFAASSGSVRADDTTAADHPWLKGEVRGEYVAFAYGDNNGVKVFGMEGAVAMQTNDDAVAFSFEELNGINVGPCANEPHGAVSVREAGGVWHDVLFDGPEEGEDPDPALCDGCGRHFAGGQEGESVCLGPSVMGDLTQWESHPW